MLPNNTKTKIVVSAFALSALSVIALSASANATSTQFPDEMFYWCVMDSYDSGTVMVEGERDISNLQVRGIEGSEDEDEDEDEYEYEELTPDQLASITALYCSWNSSSKFDPIAKDSSRKLLQVEPEVSIGAPVIYDVTGIELLPNLQVAYLGGNAISEVDLLDNTELEYIDLSNNNITSIILPQSENLTSINLSNNKLRNIDLSVVPNLIELDLSDNYFESIDLSGNPTLQYLALENNNLRSLDLSHNSYLYSVYTDNNPLLEYVDLSNNALIGGFWTGVTPVYLGNKAFVDEEDGLVKVNLGNLTFGDEEDISRLDEDMDMFSVAPGLGGDSITGLPDIDEPVAPEMPFFSIDESDEYHVEIVDGVRTLVFDDFNDDTSNIIGLTSYYGNYKLLVNFAAVRDEGTQEDTPGVPDTGIFTNEETSHELGFVAIAVAAVATLGCIITAIAKRVRKHHSVRKF